MSKTVQWKRGNSVVNSTYVGAQGEITINTDNWNLHVHDGLTPGGYVIDSSNGGASFGNMIVTGNITTGNLAVDNLLDTNVLIATGNVTASYFIGNGSLLTGITSYSNSNVLSLGEVGWAGNIIPASNAVYSLGSPTNQWANLYVADNTIYIGNIALGITESNILTVNNQQILSNNSSTSINTDGNITAGNLSAYRITTSFANVEGDLTTNGNITADYFIGNGEFLTGLPAGYANSNVASYGEVGWAGNIIPNANAVYTLGNITNQWANLWVANNTIYLGNVAIGISESNVLLVNGQPTLSNNSDVSINTDGNITAGNLNAYRITTTYANVSVLKEVELIEFTNNNFIDATTSNANLANINLSGNLTTPGAINVGNMSIGDLPGYITAEANIGIILNTSGSDGGFVVDYLKEDGNVNTSAGELAFNSETGNTTLRISLTDDADDGFATKIWRFDGTGNLTLPSGGNIISAGNLNFNNGSKIQSSVNNINLQANVNGAVELKSHGGNYTWAFDNYGWLYLPEADAAYTPVANGSVLFSPTALTFKAGMANLIFEQTGNLTLSSEGNIVGITPNNAGRIQWLGNSSGDGAGYTTLGLIPDDTLVGNDQYLIIDPTAPGHIHIRAGGTQDNSNADLILGGENSYFKIAAGANAQAQISANSHSWTFGVDGTFTLPTDAGLNGSQINSVSNSSGDLNGYTTLQLIPDVTLGTGTDQYLIIDPTAPGHIHIRAGGTQDNSSADLILGGEYSHVRIPAGANSSVYVKSNDNNWTFGDDGWLTIPGSIYSYNNLNFETPGDFNPSVDGNILLYAGGRLDIVTNNDGGGAKTWGFSDNGNLSAPGNVIAIANISANYFVGNGSLLTGISAGTNYTNTNVVNLLAAFGSNTIVTTGNISGNIVAASSNTHVMFNDNGLINGSSMFTFNKNGNILTVGTTGGTLSVADIQTPQAGVSLRFIPASGITRSYGHLVPQFANTYDLGQSSTRWQNMYANLANVVSLTVTGNLSTIGNLTAGNVLANTALRFDSGNAKITTSSGSIVITPDTNLDALSGLIVGGSGYILSSNGSRNATLNYNSESGHVGIQANLTVGTVGQGKLTVPGTSGTGANSIISGVTNTIFPNTIAAFSANINNYSQLTIQNKNTGADATADLIVTADNGSDTVNFADFGIINSGYDNSTPTNSLGNIVYAADTYLYAQGNSSATSQSGGNLALGTTVAGKTVKIFAGGANSNSVIATISNTGVVVNGNLSATNLSGNISITGNVTGTSANVELVAGSYTWTFNNAGNLVLPSNTFAINYANGTVVSLGGAGSNYTDSNVVTLLSNFGSNSIVTTGNANIGNIVVKGNTTTGVNATILGVTNTILPNTITAFSANVNSYSQITFQNKSTGSDATADLILTADNGSDTVNYADFGIINSGYDNATPTNSLGNLVFAADTYIYAQGNTSATSQSGGNLVIGTTIPTKTIKLFAGGANVNSLIANISSTGIAVTGNVSVSGNVTGTTPNVNLVAGSYTYTFDNTGNVTINGTGIRMPSRPASRVYGSSSNNIVANTTLTSSNFTVDYNQGSHLNAATGVFTAPVAGMYQTTLNARIGNNNGLNQILVLKNNGTLTGANVIAFWETDTNTGTASHFGTSGVANLVAGDTLRVKVVAGNIQFDSNDSWTVTYIG